VEEEVATVFVCFGVSCGLDLVLELQAAHVLAQSVPVPPVDFFLEKLHRLAPRRNVKNHEEHESEADHDRNADANLVE